MGRNTSSLTATITSGTSLSAGVFVGDKVPTALVMPAAWTAADITFQVSDDNVTWYDLLQASNGLEVKVTSPAAAQWLQLDPSDFVSVTYLKIRSGVTALAVNQGADRTFKLVSRKYYAFD